MSAKALKRGGCGLACFLVVLEVEALQLPECRQTTEGARALQSETTMRGLLVQRTCTNKFLLRLFEGFKVTVAGDAEKESARGGWLRLS
jgi:hypothetical protein